ncbi:MAG TPA: hypothetical protein VFS53_04865 [Gemmatimonadota bacterium]|nr:hypothetical protein [Gemmatimonadota bacterium]
MRNRIPFAVAAAAVLALAVPGSAQTHASAPAPYQAVATLVDLPDFIPGMGSLYVDPATLPAGPFLAYDREGHLVSSVYMIPLAAMNEHQSFEGLAVGDGDVDHVDIQYNAGHPGVAEPHYHVTLWYVSEQEAAGLQ